MIAKIRRLYLYHVLGWRANAEEVERLHRVIIRTNLQWLPGDWSKLGDVRSIAPGRRGQGADYFFIIHITRVLSRTMRPGLLSVLHVHVCLLITWSDGILRHLLRMSVKAEVSGVV